LDSNYLINRIFDINHFTEQKVIEEVYQFQYQNNEVYKNWCDNFKNQHNSIPFLPISFFKTHQIKTTAFEPVKVFESSGTTKANTSKHFIKDVDIYTTSFLKAFHQFYGDNEEYCVIGLLPSYLERKNSSLVFMVDELMKLSHHPKSGFYLNQFQDLAITLQELNTSKQKVLLIGVTYALLDFAEQFPMKLKHTIVMETGGMKGRKKEITKSEVHQLIREGFGVSSVHSEYGMTELLSQAYSKQNDRYYCPPWMKVFVRSEEDPLEVNKIGKGVINIIDLANLYSCAFIATDDVGEVFEDGSFTIYGRLDNSDLRGCSLLMVNDKL
jgi:hypothetical protein